MIEIINENILEITISFIIVGLGGGYYLFITKNKQKTNHEVVNPNKIKKISEQLQRLEEEFIQTATSYYLRLRLLESKFSTDKQKEILFIYPKVISQPKLKWNDFIIINEDGTILNKLLEEKIKNYSEKDSYTLKASYNYMLLEQAKERAKEIIKEKEKDV